jgi:CheY-like chemotaxis protein
VAKVLLVEDDNNLREIYQARLTAEGYDIVTAQNGEEALVVAKQNKPDLIISDVMMPRISGFEMLDILRNTDELKHTRVIMLTALGQADDQKRANNLGADRYLVKSQVTLEDIVNAAKELLIEDGSAPAPAQQAVNEPVSPATAQVPDASAPAPFVPTVSVTAVQVAVEPVASPAPTAVPAPASAVAPIAQPVTTPTLVAPAPLQSAAPQPTIPAAPQSVAAPAPVASPAPTAVPAPASAVAPVAEPMSAPPPPSLTPVEPPATPLTPPTAPEAKEAEPIEEPVTGPTEPASAPSRSIIESAAQGIEAEEAALQAQIASYSNGPSAPQSATTTTNDQAIAEAVKELNNSTTPEPATPPPSAANSTVGSSVVPAQAAPGDSATIAGKKIIQPINDMPNKPDLNALLAKEEAKDSPNTSQAPAAVEQAAPGVQPPAPAPAQTFDPNTSL